MPNRLSVLTSPYLKQHENNPVDWYPWDAEALERAKREDKPILLSVGYSSCHWCHVMAHESFENAETAAFMNAHFVNIKVDREERPDIDQMYQWVVQIMGRSGGWPLTVFLLPDLRPFWGGTYFPPVPRYGMPGFLSVLHGVVEAYQNKRDELEQSANDFHQVMRQLGDGALMTPETGVTHISKEDIVEAARKMVARFDDVDGGFGQGPSKAPKFPNTMLLDVFLRAYHHTGDVAWLDRVTRSLDCMRMGGIFDQLGGGFHRYSTDAHWLVPHFEKMLYDNALLLRMYTDAWRLTQKPAYARVVEETVGYILREMQSPEGAFYSSQDADSEGVEGKFFVWHAREVESGLGDDAAWAQRYWGVKKDGNFEGANVLHVNDPSLETVDVFAEIRERVRSKLFSLREQRVKPFRDEKIIASWNGLMIEALIEAAIAFEHPEWLEAARKALAFIAQRMWVDDGLCRIYASGRVGGEGFLDDYAAVGLASVRMYEATADKAYRSFADRLSSAAIEKCWDSQSQRFRMGPKRSDVLLETTDLIDTASPSGTALMCQLLLELEANDDKARAVLEAIHQRAMKEPMAFGRSLCVLDSLIEGRFEAHLAKPEGTMWNLLAKANLGIRSFRFDSTLKDAVRICMGRTCLPDFKDSESLSKWLISFQHRSARV